MTQPPPQQPKKPPVNPVVSSINVWGTAGEIGLLIALPLVALILLGIKLDKYLGTTPLFIIVGLLGSMVVSGVAIARKIKRLQ